MACSLHYVSAAAQTRKKDGKSHRYFSVVENQRVAGDRTVQRTVLYLGEINDSPQTAWRKTLEVFDEEQQQTRNLSLFPDDREVPADTLDSLQVNLAGLELRRPRPFGNCWLASELWGHLGLTEFWGERLPAGREEVSWEKVLRLLVVNRLLEPGSEFRVHRHWFVESAMDELLEADFAVAGKDRLYRCLDRIVEHKQELFVHLKQKWAELFAADFEVLVMPRYTQPSQEVQILLDKLRVDLPKQPPPRIKAPAAVAPITALPVATPLQFAD